MATILQTPFDFASNDNSCKIFKSKLKFRLSAIKSLYVSFARSCINHYTVIPRKMYHGTLCVELRMSQYINICEI